MSTIADGQSASGDSKDALWSWRDGPSKEAIVAFGAAGRGDDGTKPGTRADAFLRSTQHPTLGRGYLKCAFAPMVELLGFLEKNGFSNYIVSGGGRDFVRPISQEMYGIPRERVIGSATALAYTSDDRGG